MPETSGHPTWWILVLSSALISAFVNVFFGILSKWWDHSREDTKAKQRRAHIYLDIALRLEGFAQIANSYIDKIDVGLWHLHHNHDETFLDKIGTTDFNLAFTSEPGWTELPVDFTAAIRGLPMELENTSAWISDAWRYWADTGDAWEFEKQRAVLYGQKACALATRVRRTIKLKPSPELIAYGDRFKAQMDEMASQFQLKGEKGILIPELEAKFRLDRDVRMHRGVLSRLLKRLGQKRPQNPVPELDTGAEYAPSPKIAGDRNA